jgi:NADH dehydrogenase FAD-containing subunit
MVGMQLVRTAADWPLRRKLKQLGVETITDAAIRAWRGTSALLVDLRDGSTRELAADTLVHATCNRANDSLSAGLAGDRLEVHSIGDCVAPRLASMAIHEGRKLALSP